MKKLSEGSFLNLRQVQHDQANTLCSYIMQLARDAAAFLILRSQQAAGIQRGVAPTLCVP